MLRRGTGDQDWESGEAVVFFFFSPIYMYVFVWVYECSACDGQKRVLEPLELE